MTSTVPASMGEPLSEADRARRLTEIRAHFKAANVDVPLDAPMKERTARVSAGIGLMSSGREYTEVLLAHIDALEGQLATARELARDWQRQIGVEKDRADDDRLTEVERAEGLQRAAQLKRHARQLHEALGPDPTEANSVALGLDGGGSDA